MSPRTIITLAAISPSLKHRKPRTSEAVSEICAELFELLEEYGPMWYPEDLHNRAALALDELERKKGFSPIRERTSGKRVSRASTGTVTCPQSEIGVVSTAARSSLFES
jgi:hypothetical protein